MPLNLPDAILLEGIVTTDNLDGSCNVSPMGPIVDWPITRLRLRPFRTSTTYANLRRTGRGVLNVTDDVELIARAAIGRLSELPNLIEDPNGGRYLADACRWYAFVVESMDDSNERTDIRCTVVNKANLRDFFGLNRAKHAVIEAAILATRIEILPAVEIQSELQRLAPLIEKTGSRAEHRAFQLLTEYVNDALVGQAIRERDT